MRNGDAVIADQESASSMRRSSSTSTAGPDTCGWPAEGGTLKASGAIGLLEPRQEDCHSIELTNGRIRQSIVEVMATGRVTLDGSPGSQFSVVICLSTMV